MKSLSLRTKLILASLAIASTLPVLATVIYFQVDKMSREYSHVADVNLPKTKALGEILFMFREIRIQVRSIPVVGVDQAQRERYVKATLEAITKFEQAMATYKGLIESQREQAQFNKVESAWAEFLTFGQSVLALEKSGTTQSMAELARQIRDICPVKAAPFEDALSELTQLQSLEAKSYTTLAHDLQRVAVSLMVFGSIFAVLLAVVLGFVISRALSRKLSGLASRLSLTAIEVDRSAKSLASSSDAMAQSATEQAASLEQTASAIEQLSSMVSRNSESAQAAARSSLDSRNRASEGHEVVGQMIRSMDEINEANQKIMAQVNSSNEQISGIIKVIEEIGSKTKVINDIVFQTKLLSFNASVEAARAGEHGKGFSVVAEEVGNLARMSGGAAQEISAMLEQSLNSVREIVASTRTEVEHLVQEGKLKVDEGTKVARRCGEVLGEIVKNVSDVSQISESISTASQEQAHGVSEITKAMAQLDQVTHVNSTASEATASSARDLSGQSDQLKDAISDLVQTIEGHAAAKRASKQVSSIRDTADSVMAA